MLNRFKSLSLSSLAVVLSSIVYLSPAQASIDPISTNNAWKFDEAASYKYAKGSSSQLLTLKEAVPHHTLSIKVQMDMINSFTFKVGCMLKSPTPLFELSVNSLDIRLYDAVNDYVFARFVVDKGQEYSLRGELAGKNRILFAPITKNQEKSLSDIFLQMREGGELQVGLLQGTSNNVRVYKVPLAGFMEQSNQILESCQNFFAATGGQREYMPEYVAKEPDGYAPSKDYNLKETDGDVVDPNAIKEGPPAPQPAAPTPEVPEVLPFALGGGPVSIGPDGKPIGADGSAMGGRSGGNVDKSFGSAQGPMQIGADGKPVTTAPAQQAPAPAPQQQAPAQNQAPAEGGNAEEGGFFDNIF